MRLGILTWMLVFEMAFVAEAAFTPVSQESTQGKPANEDKPKEAAIEISGRALDSDGAPIAGARIYLVSTNGVDKSLGQTLTDSDGNYRFRNIQLPINHRDIPGGITSGTFQVFGEAKEYGLAWHGMRHYQPKARPKDADIHLVMNHYFQDDAIEIDLIFRPAAELSGIVKDEKGKPIADATIHLSGMDYLDTEGREMDQNHREFWAQRLAPSHFRVMRTDAEGRFTFKGLPLNTVGYLRIEHAQHAKQTFYAAISAKPISSYEFVSNYRISTLAPGVHPLSPVWETRKVRSGALEIAMPSTRLLTIQVINDDNEAPASEAMVYAAAENGTHGYGKTDKQGSIELKLPPDDYRLSVEPPRGGDYVHTKSQFTITADTADQSTKIRLTRGCVLVFEAIDAENGSPVEGVSFWYGGKEGEIEFRKGVQGSTTYVDHPVTDALGIMRAVVPPGTRKYGAGFTVIPNGYQGDLNGVFINCESGKTIDVQFKLQKKK